MGLRCLSLIVAISTFVVVYGQSPRPVTMEQLLVKEIFVDYDKRVRPVLDSRQIVNVSIGIELTMVFDVNERNQTLTTHMWLHHEWRDPRLVWDPVKYENFSKLRIPCELIWLPDILLYNSAEDQSRKYHKALAKVDFEGNIMWYPIVRFLSFCKLDITYFPFDDQICSLKLGSWTYTGLELDVFNIKSKIGLTYYEVNGEWDVQDTHVVKNVVYYPCCKEPFPDLTFYIHIRRRHFYYIFNVVVPCIFLSLLTIFSFVLPPDSGERVFLGLTVLVAYSVFILLIAEIMPATSDYTPLMSIFVITSMGLMSCIVIFSILVLNLHHRGVTNGRPPALLYHLIVRRLGRVLCVSQKSSEMFTHAYGSVFPTSRRYQMLRGRNLAAAALAVDNLRKSEQGDSMGVGTAAELDMGVDMLTVSTCSIDKKAATENNKTKDNNNKQSAVNQTQLSALNHLQYMDLKQARIEEETTCIREWQLIAFVLDRLFLVCFVVQLLIITVYLLVMRPLTRRINTKPLDS